MRIALFSWRDPKNPLAGGAEQVTLRYAEKWVELGYKVYWVTSKFKGATARESINGVSIIRIGYDLNVPILILIFNYLLFYLSIIIFYFRFLRGRVDLVIDQIHGIPFLTPLYVKEKKVLFICEVAGEIWNKMFPFPINIIGSYAERLLLKFYRKIKVWTISYSTKEDLLKFNFDKSRVEVVPLGINNKPLLPENFPPQKEDSLTLLFVGRLVKMKGIEDAINCITELVGRYESVKLNVIGKGDLKYQEYLEDLVSSKNLGKNITFLGYVDEETKNSHYKKSHILIHPSVKEGFGLTVIEAGANGTPSVVYNIHGLKDLVDDGHDGLVCEENNPKDLSRQVNKLFEDKALYNKLQENMWNKSKKFTWKSIKPLSLDVN